MVPQPSELRFGVVRAVGRGIAVLEGGVDVVQGENLTTFPFGKHITRKHDSWAFWRYIQFQDQRRGL